MIPQTRACSPKYITNSHNSTPGRQAIQLKNVDQKAVLHLHNGILCSRNKEGTTTLHDSIDGTGEHYAK